MKLLHFMIVASMVSTAMTTRVFAEFSRPSAPPRPTTGPGSTQYAHAAVNKSCHGSGERGYFIFSPDEPRAANAPVIVFLHGFGEIEPGCYGAWIMHLVKRGNIVIFPRYQGFGTLPRAYLPNAVSAVKDALAHLDAYGVSPPDKTKFAVLGHSCGGLLAGSFAAVAVERGLPTPRAVMCVEPGRSIVFPTEDYAKIPAETLLLTVAGDLDPITSDNDARKIFEGAVNVRPENRNLLIMQTDTHGLPWFVADHASPASIDKHFEGLDTARPYGQPDAISKASELFFAARNAVIHTFALRVAPIEYMGYWRLFDSLAQAGFTGEDRDAALGDTDRQRDMGKWSDGTPVKQPKVVLAN